jgi:hypothetical protein
VRNFALQLLFDLMCKAFVDGFSCAATAFEVLVELNSDCFPKASGFLLELLALREDIGTEAFRMHI